MRKSKWFSPETDKMLACPCCGKCVMSSALMLTADQIRQSLGRPMIVTSGCRCEGHNDSLPGSSKLYVNHVRGFALDIKCANSFERGELLTDIMLRRNVVGIGIAKTFIHIDVNPLRDYRVIWLYN